MNVLTSDRLAFLGALGSRASGTYVEWHERPTKRSAGHFKQVFFFSIRFGKIPAGGAMPSWLTLWKCTAFCIEIHMVKTVRPCRGVRDPTTKKKKKKETDGPEWVDALEPLERFAGQTRKHVSESAICLDEVVLRVFQREGQLGGQRGQVFPGGGPGERTSRHRLDELRFSFAFVAAAGRLFPLGRCCRCRIRL